MHTALPYIISIFYEVITFVDELFTVHLLFENLSIEYVRIYELNVDRYFGLWHSNNISGEMFG